jgi:hypothetical protein
MGDSPRWLSSEQIKRRLDVLKTVRALLDRGYAHDRTNVETRFRSEVVSLASSVIHKAEIVLSQAQYEAAEKGAAPIGFEVLELVRRFNAIGSTRLKTLLRMKGPLRWT